MTHSGLFLGHILIVVSIILACMNKLNFLSLTVEVLDCIL